MNGKWVDVVLGFCVGFFFFGGVEWSVFGVIIRGVLNIWYIRVLIVLGIGCFWLVGGVLVS